MLCLQPEPFLGLPRLEKMLLVPAGSGPRGPGGHLGILGREKHTLPQLWPESSNSRKQLGGTPREEGASPFPLVEPLRGEKWEPDLELSKGYFSRIGPGLMLEAPSLRGGQGGGRGWSEWPSLKRDFSSRLPTSLLPGASAIRLLLFALAACQVTGPDCFFPPRPFTA